MEANHRLAVVNGDHQAAQIESSLREYSTQSDSNGNNIKENIISYSPTRIQLERLKSREGLSLRPRRSMEADREARVAKTSPKSAHFSSRFKSISPIVRVDPPTNNGHSVNGTTSGLGQTPLRVDDASEHKSSRDGSLSSSSETHETVATSSPLSLHAPQQHQQLRQQQQQPSRMFRNGEILGGLAEDYDLEAPVDDGTKLQVVETVSDVLLSKDHLQTIFADPNSLLKFTSFLRLYRPKSLPILIYYLDATKALKAVSYASAIAETLDPITGHQDLTPVKSVTLNAELKEKATRAFNLLVEYDLPHYVTHMYIRVVKASMINSDTWVSHSQETSDGFAEVFCLTDPSRPDNPIIFASEAFQRMTQYGMNYIIGRNCRFLQGPRTNPSSLKRIRDAIAAGNGHSEVILNYRRDGSSFLNLLMHAPLYDHTGKVRYFMGAQLDVSSAMEESAELESVSRTLRRLERENNNSRNGKKGPKEADKEKEFQDLVEMLDMQELRSVRNWEERMLQENPETPALDTDHPTRPQRPDFLSRISTSASLNLGPNPPLDLSYLHGLYNNYLLVRPFPSLRILFASPSLTTPTIVQSPILTLISGSSRVRDRLTQALTDGNEVTAKVRWTASASSSSSPDATTTTTNNNNENGSGQDRWIYFTPLVGSNGQIGVWMAVLVDDEPRFTDRMGRASAGGSVVGGAGGRASPIAEEGSELDEEDLPPPPVFHPLGLAGAESNVYSQQQQQQQQPLQWNHTGPSSPTLSSGGRPGAPSRSRRAESPVSQHTMDSFFGTGVDSEGGMGGVGGMSGLVGMGAGDEGDGEEYESLSKRLARKRERDRALMLEPGRRTYKSLAPDVFPGGTT